MGVAEEIKREWLGNVRGDILAGITVAFALIPGMLSFALIAGVNPTVSLTAAFFMAVTISLVGGRSGMISSSTGAMSLLMGTLVAKHGVEYLFAATILTGITQFTMGRLKFGRFISFVPHPVMLGFVNALGIMIFMAQLPSFKGESWPMYAMVVATVALIFLLPRFIKVIPAALIAIIAMTLAAIIFHIKVGTIAGAGTVVKALPSLHFPRVPLTFETLWIILPFVVSLSVVGLLESLLTARVLDGMIGNASNKNREMWGQGIANVVTGIFGGMAGCALIGPSILNVKSGGRGRLSAFVTGVCMFVMVILLADFVQLIPMAALVGVMIIVCYETMNLRSLVFIHNMPLADAVVMLVTMAIVLATHDLGKGVFVGIILSALHFGWKFATRSIVSPMTQREGKEHYQVRGELFFGTAHGFVDSFDCAGGTQEILIDLSGCRIWDGSGVSALEEVVSTCAANGRLVSLMGVSEQHLRMLTRSDVVRPLAQAAG